VLEEPRLSWIEDDERVDHLLRGVLVPVAPSEVPEASAEVDSLRRPPRELDRPSVPAA
jgi:hypothetical protein